jgi:general stress protein 26
MTSSLSIEARQKLKTQQVIWFGSVRPDGRPHLAPVWYVWFEEKIYLGTDPKSVKADNIRTNPKVVVALQDGEHPVICEGLASILTPPIRADILAAFYEKYEWKIENDERYNLLVSIEPRKWLIW